MFADIDRGVTPLHVIGAIIIALALYAFLWFIAGPRLDELTGGVLPFDVRLTGYTQEEAVAVLAALGEEGSRYYLGTVMIVDIFFPAFMFLATASLFLWLTRPGQRFSAPLPEGMRLAVLVLALFAFLLDWGENIVVFLMLMGDGHPSGTLVNLGSTFTYLKTIAYILSFAALVITAVLAVIRGFTAQPARS